MGIISRLGRWLDARFPERIPVEEVYKSLAAYSHLDGKICVLETRLDQVALKLAAFETGARAFDKTDQEIKDEINRIKAVLAVVNRSRTTPVMPSGEPWKR